MRKSFTFAGKSSFEFGVYISGSGTYGAPQRAYELLTVPGRSGSLIVDNKRLEDITVTYPAFIQDNLSANIEGLRNYLLSKIGWQRLTDDYHPNEYRMALYQGAFVPTVTRRRDAASFNLAFLCKPQRYLVSGETAVSCASGTHTITNPTLYSAKPLIRVQQASGAVKVSIGSTEITVAYDESTSYPITIDCDSMQVYDDDGQGVGGLVTMTSLDFPELAPGENAIAVLGGTVEITPRWYKL